MRTAPKQIKYRGRLYKRADADLMSRVNFVAVAGELERMLHSLQKVDKKVIASFIEYGNTGGPPSTPGLRKNQMNSITALLRDLIGHAHEMKQVEQDR